MNKTNDHLYLPLVQALAEGKEIEMIGSSGWVTLQDFVMLEAPYQYRIKPEPKTAWYRVAETTLGLIVSNNARDEPLIEYSQTFKRWLDTITYEVTE